MNKILFSMLLLSFSLFALGQSSASKKTWDYPIKPGMEAWKSFKTSREKIAVCQIPENVISAISTKDLAEICMQYPLLYDIYAFENLGMGLEKLYNDFNGVRELCQRGHGLQHLLTLYKAKFRDISVLYTPATDIERGQFTFYTSAIEALASLWLSKNPLDKVVPKGLLKQLMIGYEIKRKHKETFGGIGYRTSFYARAHALIDMKADIKNLPHRKRNSAFTSGYVDEQSAQILDELSNDLIK
jgi:hypothetical protein